MVGKCQMSRELKSLEELAKVKEKTVMQFRHSALKVVRSVSGALAGTA